MIRRSLGVFVTAALLAACGGSDAASESMPGISSATVKAVSGVYQMTSFSENSSACSESPGTDATVPGNFRIAGREIAGRRYLDLVSCSSVVGCLDETRTSDDPSIRYGFVFGEQPTSDQLTGFEAGAGYDFEGLCVDRTYTDDLFLMLSQFSIQVERRQRRLADVPSRNGACVADPAAQAEEASTAPCAALTVLKGQKITDLP